MSDSSAVEPATAARARAELFLDADSARLTETRGALSVAEGRSSGRRLRLVLTDRAITGGSFGVDESDSLAACLQRSRDDGTPVVLVLDSAGARLDSGLAGLAAFRRMYRAALQLRVAGVPMLALVERDCFGGASMLAMLCVARAASTKARIGMSGPAIVETVSGQQELDASDATAVQALFGAAARHRAGAIDLTFDETASRRDVLGRLLALTQDIVPDLRAQHRALGQRLRQAAIEATRAALPQAAARFRRGQPVGAADIWCLADALLGGDGGEDNGRSVTLNIDCPGHSALRCDESVVLSEYVAHLALCLRERCAGGREVVVRITGESAGGIYVALAAGADRVEATPRAIVRVLPATAVRVVLKRALPEETFEDMLRAGVVDRAVPLGNGADLKQ